MGFLLCGLFWSIIYWRKLNEPAVKTGIGSGDGILSYFERLEIDLRLFSLWSSSKLKELSEYVDLFLLTYSGLWLCSRSRALRVGFYGRIKSH